MPVPGEPLTKPLDERIPVWLAALEAGYLSVGQLVRWADDGICRSLTPPFWLPDLCLAQTLDDVEALLRPAWSRHQERDPGCIARAADPCSLTVGFLWLNYERGNCPLERALQVASEVVGHFGYEDGKFVYLDWLHDLKYALPAGGIAEVEADVRAALADEAQLARERLSDLPPAEG